ncbi:hypothetical protein PO878_18030 [Iamia majanohamensis]|uniref:Uncharacterized protein n=1 Tax=Iamia majanohamensis TaxID=467976 RepID=A0AAF0BV38_9ACTN|nr:hypothetical protein [Iamia majanohamensis]WCO66400.1 hypothetical protein PO878_18030 [Iamia majanohamensis]
MSDDPTAPPPGDDPGSAEVVLRDPDDGGPTDPMLIRDPPPQPLFSLRRLFVVLALAVAVGAVVVAVRSGGGSEGGETDAAVVAYDPAPGGQVTRQAPVGVELEQGYDGRLTIDGVDIPEEQMVGAIVPGSEAYAALSEEQRSQGPRPNNKNLVKFQPGPGQAITEYDTGSVDITVEYWPIAEGRDASRSTTYTIRVF